MSDLDVLDFATPATANTETNANPADAPAAATAEANKPLYPNVLKVFKASEVPDGETPVYNGAPTMSITDFAGYLTVKHIQEKGAEATQADIVDRQFFYTGVKAVRNPIPVVLVVPDDAAEGDYENAKVYLPLAEAEQAYKDRPVRGEGSTAQPTSKLSDEDLLAQAAKKLGELNAQKDRAAKLADKIAKSQAQYDKVFARVQARNLTQEHVDNTLKAQTEAAESAEENGPSDADANAEAPANA